MEGDNKKREREGKQIKGKREMEEDNKKREREGEEDES